MRHPARLRTLRPVRSIPRGAFAWGECVKKADPFYKLPRWVRLRAAILRRDGYMCQVARRYGKRAEASTVHHIFPRELFPEYQWEPWNLVSLSAEAHDHMHDRTGCDLSAAGRELLRRTARAAGVDVPERYRRRPAGRASKSLQRHNNRPRGTVESEGKR